MLTGLELARAAQKAVALAQQDKSAWTRADVIKYLGRVLPRTGMDPAAAAGLLEELADRALASEFEPVACLEAPEPAEVPPACGVPTGAASTSGTAVPGTRRARSWPWKNAWPRKPARTARRAYARGSRARARRGSGAARGRAGRTPHARASHKTRATRRIRARAAGCARTRPPPRSPS